MPKALIFSLNRVSYNFKAQALEKSTKRFEFDEVIYADRFLFENKNGEQKIEERIKMLRDKQRVIKEKLDKYRQLHGEGGMSMQQILDMTAKFIESQTEEFIEIAIPPGGKVNSPTRAELEDKFKAPSHLGNLGRTHQDVKMAVNLIRDYSVAIKRQIEEMEKQWIQAEDEIKKVYNCMKQNPYTLHAILIHEGTTDNGHYFTFIKDKKTKKWYRFNDYKVTEETEETVMQESFGDPSLKHKRCAYGLIYVNKDILQSQQGLNLSEYNLALQEFIPKNLKEQIKRDDQNFNIELTNYQVEKIVKNIIEEFNRLGDRIVRVNQNNNSTQSLSMELINFNFYLLKQAKQPDIAKWLLLNSCFKQQHKTGVDLNTVAKDDIIYLKLL